MRAAHAVVLLMMWYPHSLKIKETPTKKYKKNNFVCVCSRHSLAHDVVPALAARRVVVWGAGVQRVAQAAVEGNRRGVCRQRGEHHLLHAKMAGLRRTPSSSAFFNICFCMPGSA